METLCPFIKEECDDKCMLWISINTDDGEICECSFYLIATELMNLRKQKEKR